MRKIAEPKVSKCLYVFACMMFICVFVSCNKDEEKKALPGTTVYRYWENGASYVECDIPGFSFQLNKIRRTENDELEMEYTLTNTYYDYSVSATLWTSEFEAAIHDDTGRSYMCKVPGNGDYYATIDGTGFGMYGQGWTCSFYSGRPVLGRVLIHNFSQTATAIWMTIFVDSNDLGISRCKLEFVNIPIEQSGVSVVYKNK